MTLNLPTSLPISIEMLALIIGAVVFMVLQCAMLLWSNQLNNRQQQSLKEGLLNHQQSFKDAMIEQQQSLKETLIDRMNQLTQSLDRRLSENLLQQAKESIEIQKMVQQQLKEISHQVERRLSDGFEKTTATFTDIVKRLALIDDAQKKLTELSTNVVSLKEILIDKRSRGAFGEVQLKNLVQNMLPPDNYAFQHTLKNGLRADCILFLPEPTGNVVIDSKFPLENFQIMTNFSAHEADRKKAQQNFRQDIKKHITDIASKYIIEGETSDGAVLFIPAEAVFSEIHAHFPDLVEFAQRENVWLASPTTLMAILTTARAVLKDHATKKHIHIIQEHLRMLAKDFERFEGRMDNLAKNIEKAHSDVQQVHTSAKKITSRFGQIEKSDLTLLSSPISPVVDVLCPENLAD